ncbi:MAG: hypothetical protein A2284_00715 [Deltaproteobacteria bacterium RIFOXYA12_FULL_61_11]|nr:MAG: hypothetical protein A2284_00715 [Deltaproteobacteria bacterium RIFOXYA12_FULL_61_11]
MPSDDVKQTIERRERELRRTYFRELLGGNPELRRYYRRYLNDVNTRFREITEEALLRSFHRSHIAIIGDIHYSKQAKKSIRNLIRKFLETQITVRNRLLQTKPGQVTIALEILDEDQLDDLEDFIADRIDFVELTHRSHFSTNWGLNFEIYYKPLFEFMRAFKIRPLPLFVDPRLARGNLAARDHLMAEKILECYRQDPSQHLFVIVGDWHSSSNHLQSELIRQINEDTSLKASHLERRICSYFLNHDKIWEWKKSRGSTVTQYFRIARNVYAVADTRPDVKFFSVYIQTNIGDDLDPEELLDDALYQQIFHSIVSDLAKILGLDLELVSDWRDKIEIFTPYLLDHFFERLTEAKQELGFISEKKLEEVKINVLTFGSCFVPVSPHSNWIFISSICTPNQYAQMATRYLRDTFITKKKAVGEINKFYLKIIDEGLRFLGNKLINSYVECNEVEKHLRVVRRCEGLTHRPSYLDLDLQVARIVLEHLKQELTGLHEHYCKDFLQNFYLTPQGYQSNQRNHVLYLSCVRSLGRILGHTIWDKTGVAGEEPRFELLRRTLLRDYSENARTSYLDLKYQPL